MAYIHDKGGHHIEVGKDDLYTVRPDLIMDWDWHKNDAIELYPSMVRTHSHKRAYWKCSKCNNEWEATIDARSRGTGCPRCNNHSGTSFPEQYIYFWLKGQLKNVDNRSKINGVEVDILLRDYNIAIEYNGLDWHKNKKSKIEHCSMYNIQLIDINEVEGKDIFIVNSNCITYGVNIHNSRGGITELCKVLAEVIEETTGIQLKCPDNDVYKLAADHSSKAVDNNITTLGETAFREYNEADNTIKATHLKIGSAYKVNWKCSKCNQIYQASPLNRKRGDGCPVCSNHILVTGINDLKTLRPLIAIEAICSYDTQKLFEYDTHRISWGCSNCGNVWKSRVVDRTRLFMGCKHCGFVLNDLDTSVEYQINKATSKFSVEYFKIFGVIIYGIDFKQALIAVIAKLIDINEEKLLNTKFFINYASKEKKHPNDIYIDKCNSWISNKVLISNFKAMQTISSILEQTANSKVNVKVKYRS